MKVSAVFTETQIAMSANKAFVIKSSPAPQYPFPYLFPDVFCFCQPGL